MKPANMIIRTSCSPWRTVSSVAGSRCIVLRRCHRPVRRDWDAWMEKQEYAGRAEPEAEGNVRHPFGEAVVNDAKQPVVLRSPDRTVAGQHQSDRGRNDRNTPQIEREQDRAATDQHR